jgi:ATP-binding cassette, subfamily B, bacterial
MNSDIQVVQDSLSTNISMFLRSFIIALGIVFMLIKTSPTLAVVTFIAILPLAFVLSFFGQANRNIAKELQSVKAAMNTVAEESISNVRIVKAFYNEDAEIQRFTEGNKQILKVGKRKACLAGSFQFLNQFLLYLGMGGVIFTSWKLFIDGKIKVGNITSFMMYMQAMIF